MSRVYSPSVPSAHLKRLAFSYKQLTGDALYCFLLQLAPVKKSIGCPSTTVSITYKHSVDKTNSSVISQCGCFHANRAYTNRVIQARIIHVNSSLKTHASVVHRK